jgi:protein disulfide-isomerase
MKTPTSSLRIAVVLFAISAAALAKPGWTENFEKGVEQAKKENKIALVDFTGSDWCSWCMKLDAEVFSKAKFKEYAKANLVLVEVDFPQLKQLPKSKQEKHDALAKEYGIKGFPSVVLLNAEGKKIGQLGYMEGGPEAFIAEIEKLKGGTK